MNILMMSNTYTPIAGGLEKSIRTFSTQLRKLGHKVTIVVPEMKEAPKREQGVLRIPAIPQVVGTDFSVNVPVPGQLSKLVDSFKPDLVHAHHPFLVGDLALRLCGQYQIPLVYTHHTLFDRYQYDLPLANGAWKHFLVRLSAGYANLTDRVIAPSESVRRILIRRGVRVPIAVVPTGIDTRDFAAGNGRALRRRLGIPRTAFVIGYSGRLAPEKNLDFLARSSARFMKKNGNVYFLALGAGPSRKKIHTFFKKSGIGNRVRFAGVLQGKQLADGYRAMDLFVFTSKSETQGLAITEAMAAGLPVITLDAPGAREIVRDKINGRLLPAQNEKAFAEALSWFHDLSPAKQKKIKQAARRSAQKFSIDLETDRMLRVYHSLRRRKLPSEGLKSTWHKLRRRIRTEWQMLNNVTKATGAALASIIKL